LVVVGRVCRAAEVSVFEPVEVSAEGGDFGLVDEPVDHRSGDNLITEHFHPSGGLLEVTIKLARS
jgi:hypothetical protein